MKYPKRCQYKHAKQKKYHVRNWAEYNEGLRRRGDLTVWFDEEAIANWKADKTGKPGGQRVYSDMAIETGLVVRMVYKLAYRQTEGFLHSIASLLGLGIEIPDYSTLCRRSRLLRKKLRIPKAASTQPIHLMIDSTGLRIHVGNARKPPKQRAWRKLHIAVDRETGNIVASELTASRARDATRVPALLTQIQAPLVSVAADSAYDKEAVIRSHRSAQSWTKDGRGDSAATKRTLEVSVVARSRPEQIAEPPCRCSRHPAQYVSGIPSAALAPNSVFKSFSPTFEHASPAMIAPCLDDRPRSPPCFAWCSLRACTIHVGRVFREYMAIALACGVRILTELRVSLRRNHHARPSSSYCALRWLCRPLPCPYALSPPPTLELESC